MKSARWFVATAVLAVLCAVVLPGQRAFSDGVLRLAITTTFENSGLAEHLLPRFEAETGIDVQPVVVGTGQAFALGRNGDVDILLVHSREAEREFLAAGHASSRRDIMYNWFVIAGPRDDPAGIASMTDAPAALRKILESESIFVSRGDDSGTHRRELSLWNETGIDADDLRAAWYRRTGSGMGATLNMAASVGGYVLVDEGTWAKFANRRDLVVHASGDERLLNPYGLLPVNPRRHPHVAHERATTFLEWLTSKETQDLIDGYRVNGRQVFHANADAHR